MELPMREVVCECSPVAAIFRPDEALIPSVSPIHTVRLSEPLCVRKLRTLHIHKRRRRDESWEVLGAEIECRSRVGGRGKCDNCGKVHEIWADERVDVYYDYSPEDLQAAFDREYKKVTGRDPAVGVFSWWPMRWDE